MKQENMLNRNPQKASEEALESFLKKLNTSEVLEVLKRLAIK